MEEKTEDRHDPGWNDPPIFSYDKATAIQASASRKGTLLNKRVAYPMTGKAVTSNPVLSKPICPPLTPGVSAVGPPPPLMGSFTTSQTVCDNTLGGRQERLTKNEKLNTVMSNLELVMPANVEEDISKRIKIMEKMWLEDKLDEHVQLKLIDLTDALSRGDVDAADHMQKGLMVDNVSQCSSWMSGIRQLINLKRNSQ